MGVRWKGGVIQQWDNRKRVFSGFRTLRLRQEMRPTLLYSIIYSIIVFPLTPKYVTLNDFEWPFYVICSLLRTATDSLFVTYCDVISGEVREAEYSKQ